MVGAERKWQNLIQQLRDGKSQEYSKNGELLDHKFAVRQVK